MRTLGGRRATTGTLQGIEEEVTLTLQSDTRASRGENVLARINRGAPSKVVIVAHFDTWFSTPGAMDNAVGTAVLLGLPSLLKKVNPELEVELFANNGEDYYNSAGSIVYLDRSFDSARTVLAINIDGIGYRGRETGLSLYECPSPLSNTIGEAQRSYRHIVDMEPWPEGDHSIFAMQGIPAITLTTLNIHDLMHIYHHTPEDRIENIDIERVAEVVEFIASLIEAYKA
ncbi:MAG: M28 family metallopeptidase [Spirochaetaceae bacterium]